MHFVNHNRRRARIASAALRQPVAVVPGEMIHPADDGGGLGPHFGGEAVRVHLQRQADAFAVFDLVFVTHPFPHARDEDFPDTGLLPQPHRMAATIPVVAIADHRDPAGVRRPDSESHAVHPAQAERMGAQFIEGAQVIAADQQANIAVSQDGQKTVGIVNFPALPAFAEAQTVSKTLRITAQHTRKQTVPVNLFQGGYRLGGADGNDCHRISLRLKGAHHQTAVRSVRMHSKYGKRVAVVARHDCFNHFFRRRYAHQVHPI